MQTILFNKSTEQVYKKGNAAENQDFLWFLYFFLHFVWISKQIMIDTRGSEGSYLSSKLNQFNLNKSSLV